MTASNLVTVCNFNLIFKKIVSLIIQIPYWGSVKHQCIHEYIKNMLSVQSHGSIKTRSVKELEVFKSVFVIILIGAYYKDDISMRNCSRLNDCQAAEELCSTWVQLIVM